jgi:hypothetical protein
MDIRKLPFLLIGFALLALFALIIFRAERAEAPTVPANQAGVKPGSTDIVYTNASGDIVLVDLPFPNAVVGKKFSVIGKARGPWYFEASFPVMLLDKDGNILAEAVAQAEGEWMTNEFVPFKADLEVPASYIGSAALVLKKDNPSGMAEHDASVSFPITVEY